MYGFISVHPINIYSDTVLLPRLITPSLTAIRLPRPKTPENRGTLNMVPVQAQGISSLTTPTSPVWLSTITPLVYFTSKPKISPTILLPDSAVSWV